MKRFNFKRLIAAISLCFTYTLCYSTIAYPNLVNFQQPNGNIVKVIMRGSEALKWAESEDGYTLLYDSIGNLVYAELDAAGDLVPSGVIAVDKEHRPVEVEQRLKSTPKQLTYSKRQIDMVEQIQSARNRQMSTATNSGVPVVGTKNMLLILVEFPDYSFKRSKKDFELLMNQLNYTDDGRYGSVRDFYLENSFGQLDLITDVVGVYRLKYDRAYYGGNTGYSNDNDPRQMAIEAITMANADVDFSKYDNDGDGTVDGVHIIYAGPGEEAGGGSDCIWAHSWTASKVVDGVRTNRYSCSPEIRGSGGNNITHIGVICHEIGHVLGAKDFYDTNYGTGGQYPGTGKWDLMASGNWNGDGACPAHFNPYSKIYDYGWATVADGNKAASFILGAKSQNSFVRIDTQTDGEFFLLEYRAKSGFDTCIPYHGLMIYRASDGLSRMSANTLNAFHKQQFYPLVANATNELPTSIATTYGSVNTSTAPFPGVLGVNEITDFTTPSMKSWIGVNTGFPITSIKENVSDESVTFDIAGGVEGGAYSFKVTDSDTTSITFSWKTPDNEKVVLAYNTEPTFGIPESRNYTAGETINGGGEVIYVGNNTTFKHNGLEQQEIYYYKLFTLRTNGTYTAGRQLKAETAVDIIRKFPYTEDFSSMVLPTTWRNELIIGEDPWKVDLLYETGNWMLIYESSFTPRRKARLIMPIIDFTDATCATLSFDYRNFLQIFEVAYRTSPTDEWHILESFEAKEAISIENTTDGEQHADYKLPNLSSNYEIAFTVDYKQAGNGIVATYQRATIDNIKLQIDFNAFVTTLRPDFISSTTAKIKTKAFDGTEKIAEKGIQWSINNTSWTTVKANENGITTLNSLPKGSTIYYRGYAKIESDKTIYGETQTFTTHTFSTGDGTEEAPYLIGSTSDWTSLRKYVDAGNDCAGLTFALKNSFTLTDLTKINKTFNGIIDGKGNTITLQSGSFNALFETIGKKGLIKNLTVKSEFVATTAHRNAMICIYNSGTINNCNIYIGDIAFNYGINYGGVCSDNKGYVVNCHSEMYVKNEQLRCGGICWYNFSLIIGCSFKGEMQGNNNAKLGGIASINYESNKNGKDFGGMIVDCINHGTMKLYENGEIGPQHSGLGGISGVNYGWIIRCLNKGDIVTYDNGGASGAGTTGGSDGLVYDCYNLGKVSVLTTPLKFTENSGTAGVVARMRTGAIKNCFSLTSVYTDNSNIKNVNEILGYNESAEINNCYYAGSGNDNYAEQRTLAEFATQELVNTLNENGKNETWILGESHPILKWEKTGVKMAIDYILDLRDTQITIPWIVLGENVSSCGVEWRKKGELSWNSIEGDIGIINNTVIDNLTPKTSYEVRLYAVTSEGTINSNIKNAATTFSSTGLANNPHLITCYEDIIAFSNMIACGETFAGEVVKLTCDLDLKGKKGILWNPMISKYSNSGFKGEFDGDGHIIRNMYINTKSGFAGFFGMFSGYIHDLEIVDSKITSHAKSSEEGNYGGTGGIIGYGLQTDYYTYMIERCGYEGSITSGTNIGGLIGVGGVARITVNDSYVKGTIKINNYLSVGKKQIGMGGIIGKGSATNSYFVGEILLPVDSTYGFVKINGIGWGPIAGLYNNVSNVNCYYNATSNKDFYTYTDDISMSAEAMQSDAFLNSLTADVWTRADHINEGYPVFASRAVSRVTTGDACHTGYGDIEINGIYTMGVDKEHHTFGFQWYSKMGDKQNIVETLVETNGEYCFSLVIPNHIVTDEGVNYRAFAVHNNDTIFGEWAVFIPTISVPQLPGDANEDGTVSISDIVTTVNYILAKSTKVFNFAAADITNDNKISITDVVGILNIILNPIVESNSAYYAKRGIIERSNDYLSMNDATLKNGYISIPISLNNSSNKYTGFQMDVDIPEGATFVSATLSNCIANTHSISWNTIADSKIRIVAYSLSNATFEGDSSELITLNFEAAENINSTITVNNVRMATADGVENAIGGCGSIIDINGATDIDSINGNTLKIYTANDALVVESGNDMKLPVYSINGRLVKLLDVTVGKNIINTVPTGVYVVNGVKLVIK